jgi:hypothetical protein
MRQGAVVWMLLAVTMSCGCQYDKMTMRAGMARMAAPAANAMMVAQPQASASSDRRVIRSAELTVELDHPAEGKRRIDALAGSMGGFVVTSEVAQGDGGTADRALITITLRVPSARFDDALAEIRKVGRLRREKITGQDVTEEYVDLEAHLRAKRAVEAQLLDILKQARKVADALEVQKALGDARAEIERLEGRRRFLEDQTTLSTLTVRLEPPPPLVSASGSGLWRDLKRAIDDGCEGAVEVVLVLIRVAIALAPVVVFLGVPGFYVLRLARRRWRLRRPAPAQ